MLFSKITLFASLSLIASTSSAQTLKDQTPSIEDTGPAGIACVYPLGMSGYEHACDFMVYAKSSGKQTYGGLVLLEKAGREVMQEVYTLDLTRVVPPGHDIVISTCGRGGRIDPAMIAMVKTSDEFEVKAVRAWLVDFNVRTFVEMANVKNVRCEQGSGD